MINLLEDCGYSVSKIDNGYVLKRKSFGLLLSSLGTILFIKELKLISLKEKLIIDIKINKTYFVINIVCFLVALTFLVLDNPAIDFVETIGTFFMMFLFAMIVIFFFLRSQIVRDIKIVLKNSENK